MLRIDFLNQYFCIMIAYNPKDWFSFIFRLHKAETFRQLLPTMFFLALYAAICSGLEIEFFNITKDDNVSQITAIFSVLGFVMSLLLVFRTNSAYDRWWEGRKLWGSLVNCSRNFALKTDALMGEASDKKWFSKMIYGFSDGLRVHLREEHHKNLKIEDGQGNVLLDIPPARHIPLTISQAVVQKLVALKKEGKISEMDLRLLMLEQQQWMEICGACERIKNTPIPFTYSAFLKKFLFFYVMTMPFAYSATMGYYVIPAVVFIFYVMASIELIGEEIENPFGHDSNDLPLTSICKNIQKTVKEVLEP